MKWRHYKGKKSLRKGAGGVELKTGVNLRFKSPIKVGTLNANANMSDQKPRIAASSYLNTAPLIWSFSHGSQRDAVELFTDTAPARCAEMLAAGEVDAALV